MESKTIYGYNIKIYEPDCIIRSTGYTTITCPTPEHVDAHPSCNFNVRSGRWKCLACGSEGTLADFEKHTGYTLEQIEIDIEKEVFHSFEVNYNNYELAINDQYVLDRINTDTIKTFGVKSNEDYVYIPVNFGYVVRSKYYPHLTDRKYYYYGDMQPYYTLNKLEYNKPLFIVEGIFGLLHLHELGYNSLCVFGTGNVYRFLEREKSKLQLFDKVYTAFDNDKAGERATSKALKYFNIIPYKYVGDIDEIEQITVC